MWLAGNLLSFLKNVNAENCRNPCGTVEDLPKQLFHVLEFKTSEDMELVTHKILKLYQSKINKVRLGKGLM